VLGNANGLEQGKPPEEKHKKEALVRQSLPKIEELKAELFENSGIRGLVH